MLYQILSTDFSVPESWLNIFYQEFEILSTISRKSFLCFLHFSTWFFVYFHHVLKYLMVYT